MEHEIGTAPSEWLETPDVAEFTLAMYDDGTACQYIRLTRDEYIALKQHLAAMRQPVKPKAGTLPPGTVARPRRASVAATQTAGVN